MDKQWVVFSREEGLIGIFDNYDEALKEYQESQDAYENFVYENGEHDPNEDIILAAIDKRFYSYDTKKPTEDDDTSTYWDFKEDSFNPDPIPPTIKPGDKVRHTEHGTGIYKGVHSAREPETVICKFDKNTFDRLVNLADLEVISHD